MKNGVLTLIGLFLFSLCGFVSADEMQVQEKQDDNLPSWVNEISLKFKESYDSNVLLQEVTDQANESSMITTLIPKVALKFEEVFDVNTFDMSYSPEINFYHDKPSEDHTVHTFQTALTGKEDDWSWKIANKFMFTQGSTEGPIYTGGGAPAIAHFQVRDRRQAIQNRNSFSFRYDFEEDWFIRFNMASVLYDFQAHQRRNLAGYQNYVDRYDVNGGFDFGFEFVDDTYFTFGYRAGMQEQSRLSWVTTDADNTYHRLLVGFEGKPWDWLTVNVCAGPDFRSYDNQIAANFDRDNTHIFLKAALTAKITEDDTLTFKAHRLQWLSSGGTVPYEDKKYTLLYKHVFDDLVSVRGMAQAYQGDTEKPWNSEDYIYTLGAGVDLNIDENWSMNFDYSIDHAESEINVISDGREYDRHIVSFTCGYKY